MAQWRGPCGGWDFLKPLNVVGLSWLTRLCNLALRCLWTGRLGWWFPCSRRVCSNYRAITVFILSEKVYARVLEKSFRKNNVGFDLVVECWTVTLSSQGYSNVCGSFPKQSTCVLWSWKKQSNAQASEIWGVWLVVTGHSVPVKS